MTRMCLQSLHRRFIDWTKPDTTSSLLLGSLTDLARSKSELVAENALLRQQLILLKRPASGKSRSDLETSAVHRSTRDAPAVASPGLQALLEIQVQSSFCHTKGSRRDRGLDQGNGKQQSTVGSGTHPWRIAQARAPRQQTHDPEVHETSAHCKATRAELEDFLTQSC
jgi:hypothetical protein